MLHIRMYTQRDILLRYLHNSWTSLLKKVKSDRMVNVERGVLALAIMVVWSFLGCVHNEVFWVVAVALLFYSAGKKIFTKNSNERTSQIMSFIAHKIMSISTLSSRPWNWWPFEDFWAWNQKRGKISGVQGYPDFFQLMLQIIDTAWPLLLNLVFKKFQAFSIG